MGIGTQPNFTDALPNDHGLTLPNKKWRRQLAFQWTFIIDRCLYKRKGEGVSRIHVSIFDVEMFGMQMDVFFLNSIDMLYTYNFFFQLKKKYTVGIIYLPS
jgi:hypothetical protein